MTTFVLIAVAGLVVFGLGALLLFRLAKAADAAAEANARAEKAEADAYHQKTYADIATQQHDAASTAGVLDQGKFFVPPAQSLHPPAAGQGRGRNQGDA